MKKDNADAATVPTGRLHVGHYVGSLSGEEWSFRIQENLMIYLS